MDRKLKVLEQIDLISYLFYIVSDHILLPVLRDFREQRTDS